MSGFGVGGRTGLGSRELSGGPGGDGGREKVGRTVFAGAETRRTRETVWRLDAGGTELLARDEDEGTYLVSLSKSSAVGLGAAAAREAARRDALRVWRDSGSAGALF